MASAVDIQVSDAIKIFDEHTSTFLTRVKDVFSPGPFKGMRTTKSDFPILSPANKYYYEYVYFISSIEWFIREELANGVICDLCNLYGLDCKVIDSSRKYIRFSNEHIERWLPFEFFISKNGKTVGYRYAPIDTDKRYIKRLLRQYRINQIAIIDWEEKTPDNRKCCDRDIPAELKDTVTHIHVQDFFNQYFSEEVFEEYIKRTRIAVQKSHDEVSIQVSPTMSLQYLSTFKAMKKAELSWRSFRSQRYLTAKLNELPQLPKTDYDAIDAFFFGDKLYRALIGKEQFAESFITSEYMYDVFENGGRFDYTAIVCGYIKSVEQLLGKLMEITLSHHNSDNLWIKCNHYVNPTSFNNVKYKQGVECEKEPKRGKVVHVRALSAYSREFDTTFTPLTWFIYDNSQYWNISAAGVDMVNDYLLEYAKEDRNEHFHKDNISEIDDVKRIRNNTILILYLLLGGYRLTGNPETDFVELGMQDDCYDRFYNRMIAIPSSTKNFLISFGNDEEIKAERLYEQERPAYDFYGGITSTIKFAPVENYHGMDFEEFVSTLKEDSILVISRTNLPEKVWFVRPDGERIQVDW